MRRPGQLGRGCSFSSVSSTTCRQQLLHGSEASPVANPAVTLPDTDAFLIARVNDEVGDRVIAEYAEALALKLKKGGGLRETVEKTDMQTAKPGQKPGAVKTREVDFVADVMEVDTKASTVTILGAKGRVVKLKIKDPAVLAEIKKGDQIEGSYVQATGIIVVPPKAK